MNDICSKAVIAVALAVIATYALLVLLVTNSSVNLINSNGALLAKFSLSGSSKALEMWMDCTGGF